MEKFVLANGKEVKVGDTLTKMEKVDVMGQEVVAFSRILVTEDNIQFLVKEGIIKPVKEESSTIPLDIDFYVEKIANKMGWKLEKTWNYLNNVDAVLPSAAFSMVLREIAIELDKKYNDHIENSPEIYVISMFDGRITKANKAHIKNYRNFAAFRNIEDAKIACKIVKPILKDMFKNEGK